MLSRRDFATVAAALWAEAVASAQHQHQHAELAPQIAAAAPVFFTAAERAALDRLTALIVPADERSKDVEDPALWAAKPGAAALPDDDARVETV
jgi:hypothetical protein